VTDTATDTLTNKVTEPMIDLVDPIRLGTRRSMLALWQTRHVQQLLAAAWPRRTFAVEEFTTQGDRVLDTPLPQIGGKGLFTLELEIALRNGKIDMAVHSLKDLPTEAPPGLIVGAIPTRAHPADVLVCRGDHTLETLPRGATIGTSSRRRAAQLLAHRPDLQIADIRGNVETRIRKTKDPDGPYDATVLAHAGLQRLEKLDVASQVLPFDIMLPAPGQGALGIQCRDDEASRTLLVTINHADTHAAVSAERAFLAGLGGGCATPVAAHGEIHDGVLYIRGRVSAPDGSQQIDVAAQGAPEDAMQLGMQLARAALEQGAARILEASVQETTH
jgi:hydroxymethylbilane synthase